MAAVWRRLCSSASASASRPLGLWSRVRSGRVGSWTESLLRDYKDACKDIVIGAKERPVRAAFYAALLTGAGVCGHYNPCEKSFRAALLDASNQLVVLSPWVRNGRSDKHVQRVVKLQNEGRLEHQSLLVFSLMYSSPYDCETSSYNAQCEHLVPRWVDFPERVLDVGFFGKWWILSSKMTDWDINEDEFSHLPPELREISPQNLNSTENERLFELKFQPVILEEEEG
ncbi:mitochondrial import inner membrane translocase subunit Tim29 [Callorhinchus milii]|uniref:mitochondrial import inner membrane translocase subunit Tim29 n=1 Tax=Callorhinchus milii TaxID=7868 RepID=UPI001C3F5E31|nr:mitochondrial import inner membrane translocase subunit Tim29 [Callorhinchus milii]